MEEKKDLDMEEKTEPNTMGEDAPAPSDLEGQPTEKKAGKKWLIPSIIAGAVALIAIILIVTMAQSPARKFKRALRGGDFAGAQKIYEENRYRSDFDQAAAEALTDYLDSVTERYVNGEVDMDAATAAVRGVESMTDVEQAAKTLRDISGSKRAAEAAKEACEQGDYYAALSQYEKIVPEDTVNYAGVDEYIASAKQELVAGALADAETARQKNDHAGAIKVLQKVVQAGYGTEEVTQAIRETATAMVDSYTKKNDALSAYQELSNIPGARDDAELKKLLDHTSALASQQILDQGRALMAEGNYAEAAKTLSIAAGELLTTEIKGELENCKTQYRQSVLDEAAQSAAAGEYAAAEALLDGYLKQYTTDEEVKDIKADYHLKTLESEQLMTVERTSVQSSFIYNKAFVTVRNNTDKVVKEYSVAMIMFDSNGFPVNNEYSFDQFRGGKNVRAGRADSANIQPGRTYGSSSYWNIEGKCTKILACVISAEFYDGTSWTNPYLDPWLERYAEKPLF